MLLVIGCGLVVESFVRLSRVDTGFRPEGLVTGQVEIVEKSYPNDDDVLGFWNRLLDEVRAQPGVEKATLALDLPPSRRLMANDAEFEGKTFKRGEGPVPNIDFWQATADDA